MNTLRFIDDFALISEAHFKIAQRLRNGHTRVPMLRKQKLELLIKMFKFF